LLGGNDLFFLYHKAFLSGTLPRAVARLCGDNAVQILFLFGGIHRDHGSGGKLLLELFDGRLYLSVAIFALALLRLAF
jgi:hypothetical protein